MYTQPIRHNKKLGGEMNSDLRKVQVQKGFKNKTLTQLGNCLYNHLNFKKVQNWEGDQEIDGKMR